MVEMARRGGGNHYYGDTAADLFEPFAEEFDFISALCARQVRLSLAAAQWVRIQLLNDYPVDGDAGISLIRLPDIAFGAEAWAPGNCCRQSSPPRPPRARRWPLAMPR